MSDNKTRHPTVSSGSLLLQNRRRWLARSHEYGTVDLEWEQFYETNKEAVPLLVGPVEELRRLMSNAKLQGQVNSEPIDQGNVVEDHWIEFAEGVRNVNIQLRSYIPDTKEKGLPAMLYFHGGGWSLGDLDGEDRTCRILCTELAMVVVSVGYRLAPEHPYPAALNDAWAALDWIFQNSTVLRLNENKILVGGTSAGANLAAVICQYAHERGIPIHGQLLRIPALCLSELHYSKLGLQSMLEMTDAAILTPKSVEQFLQWYQPSDASHVTVSPLLAPKFDGLPPTFLQICGQDPLRDEGLAYADALENAGVPVKLKVYPGLPHAFWIFPEISKTQVAKKDMVNGVRWLVDQL